jgi:LEA14-like dessication related protein
MRAVCFCALAVPLMFLATSCSRPQPPRLTPRAASVAGVSATGIQLRVELDAHNPNQVDLTVRRVDVDVTLGGQALGRSSVTESLRLVAGRSVPLRVTVSAGWRDLPGILAASVLNENIPYRLEGTARVGGERLNVDVPFRMESTLPRRILLEAAGNTVGGMPH